MSKAPDRSAWRARYEAGERTAVLAEEAGISRGHATRLLGRMGTVMRKPGAVGPYAVEPVPDYWERLEAGYPDQQRKAWVRRLAQRWRWGRR